MLLKHKVCPVGLHRTSQCLRFSEGRKPLPAGCWPRSTPGLLRAHAGFLSRITMAHLFSTPVCRSGLCPNAIFLLRPPLIALPQRTFLLRCFPYFPCYPPSVGVSLCTSRQTTRTRRVFTIASVPQTSAGHTVAAYILPELMEITGC